MNLSDFDYHLPKNLIAQQPMQQRDHSRLLIFNRANKKIEHKHFYNITDYLQAGDVVVLNNSKVFPARLIGQKKETKGKVEIFLLENLKGREWQCLVGGANKEELEVEFPPFVPTGVGTTEDKNKKLNCQLIKNNQDGTWLVKFNKNKNEVMKIAEQIGKVPTPPYIKKLPNNLKQKYQTVFADAGKVGSVAAPTAGFHFTKSLINKLKKQGVQFEYITLHVGMGTFAPVKIENIKKHQMHSERVEVDKAVLKRIIIAKQEKRRIIAVGTTSVRALEGAVAQYLKSKQFNNIKTAINIFIYPGFKFKIVDVMITNFHLPKSTLLMLISAFIDNKNKNKGIVLVKKIYQEAIKKKYRFFSFGDGMLIE